MENNISSSLFQMHQEMEWEEVAPGLKRQIIGYDDTIMMVKAYFKAGAIGSLHEHYHAQTTYVVSGKFTVTLGDEIKSLTAGDGFYVPPHVVHGAICLEEGLLIDVFSPHREDFLK